MRETMKLTISNYKCAHKYCLFNHISFNIWTLLEERIGAQKNKLPLINNTHKPNKKQGHWERLEYVFSFT